MISYSNAVLTIIITFEEASFSARCFSRRDSIERGSALLMAAAAEVAE